MTFYRTLAETERNGKTVTAYEKTEKFETVPSYEIVVSRDGMGYLTVPTARTTWRKKFRELVNEL